MGAQFDLQDPSPVVIVGSGAGGGTLGFELARRGVGVVCLEAGPRLSTADFRNDREVMNAKLGWFDRRVGSGNVDPRSPANHCKTVGGTTVHWSAISLRLQAHEWRTRSTYGAIAGANLLDWPTTHDEMQPWYALAEKKMGVAGAEASGLPRLPGNNNYKVLEYGARKLGYRQISTGNMAINSQPYDGRPACRQIGFCTSGCIIMAKWSTLYVDVPRAEQSGHFELRADCHVSRIEHDAAGKVSGVVYRSAQGVEERQRARVVCVAGNAIGTPRLLLLSSSALFPHGLANFSGQVGRNYMMHTLETAYGFMPGEVRCDRGTEQAGIVMDEAAHRGDSGFAGGFLLQTIPARGPLGLARGARRGAWGRDYAHDIESYRNVAGTFILGEDLPQEGNAVTLEEGVSDQHGLPVAHVHRVDHPNDSALRARGVQAARAVYEAAGARKVLVRGAPYRASHNMGTCRQSRLARDGVCDTHGRCHDVRNLFIADGSQFTSSAAENPTLTIVALAMRQADYIARMLTRREL